MSGCIGWIFSVVMWLGFELADTGYEANSKLPVVRQALLYQVRWMVIYLLLLTLCIGLIRLVLGFNLLNNFSSFLATALMGLLISSIILGQHSLIAGIAAKGALAKAEARAQALALQAQLSPHTLFNALNTIAALIPEAPGRAEEATERLSTLLRRIMSALERERWTLAEEFELLEDLLRLEALRFGDRLAYSLELGEDSRELLVPPLILLPLVENSLKHGFRPKVGGCQLRVAAAGSRVRVEDDGVGRSEGVPEGVGLRTVRQRLEGLGGELRWPAVTKGCAVEVAFS
jgi:LytS/YehU family sensor histidine kinase